jgi:hypothetical protein
MDPKGKRMVVNDNEKESIFNKPRDDKVNDSVSNPGFRGTKTRARTSPGVLGPSLTHMMNHVSHPDFRGPKPGREHNHQVCWDQVSHI